MTRKPWPDDCVVIVAATPETVQLHMIRGEPEPSTCHDCGCQLLVDSVTIDSALSMPERMGRPLRFLCLACHGEYAVQQIEYLTDHRTPGIPEDLCRLDIAAKRLGVPLLGLKIIVNSHRLPSWSLGDSAADRYVSLSAAQAYLMRENARP